MPGDMPSSSPDSAPAAVKGARSPASARELRRFRRSRRHPRITQFDYLHHRRLVEDLAAVLSAIDEPVRDVLDVYCGSRPYDDLLPAGARSVGLDIEDRYGVVDIVS